MLGNGRVMVRCIRTGHERNCVIRGKFKKRVWINVDDIVLIEKDQYDKNKGMVVHKYFPEEVKLLKKNKR